MNVRVTRGGSESAWLVKRRRRARHKRLGSEGVTADNREARMEVEMKIRGLMMDPATNMPIVILKDASGPSVLPIWVGIYEANAIALEIEKVATPRPMTHDLIKNLLTGLEALVRKVVVSELKDDTFFAVIWLEREGRGDFRRRQAERRPGFGPARRLPHLRRG